ncbi:DUF551 domain-containing protein [Citrobacter freundii]|uniref:DUF551 domain-containing protein n=1 Tax=Citrobacter freundii TaxID=546 RepID=UPI0023B0D4BE|nr:DUF551 domain-containing protein [Citrobacter freundii]MDN4301242.1 DUF551 domain-containing protein [Citrobacter freundii]MDT7349350.1 DUF551 domain-containing protein [Citrobacter freundii]WHB27855.1 DUF551 domain-containing protein [Citrobacter freundii]WHB29541.1 DUF551 domain-containing protein [Citrobacter freundii]
MTTNNHPANGPVSLERLHQIREILSKAAAQSDGGNLGYAMADAVKVIDGAIAAFDAEPVAWKAGNRAFITRIVAEMYASEVMAEIIPLYTAPSAPVVPDELLSAMEEVLRISDRDHEAWHKARNGIASCRAAMLQAGNSPVTPDGWINCRERLPKPNKYVLVCNGVWVGVGMYNNAEHFEDDERWQDEHGEFIDLLHHPVTHWQSLPAAPKQENV